MPEQDKYIFRNNEHFELVLKGLQAGVYEIDFQQNTQWWSSKFYELLGYKRGEIESSQETLLNELVAPEDRSKLSSVLENCQCNPDSFIIELQLRHRSGNYHWYKLSGQTKWEGDKPLYLTGTLTDIDLRIKEQLKNQRYEFFLEEVGEMAKVGGWEINLHPFYATVTKEMAIIHDLSPDDRLDFDQIIQFQKDTFKERLKIAIENAIEHGTHFDIESKVITPKNREIWVRIIGKPVFGKNNQVIGLRGVFQDIDAQKKAQLEIQKNQALLESVGQMAKIGGWEVNMETMQGNWSKEVSIIHEMPVGYQPSLEEAVQFVHPDYIPRIEEVMGKVFSEGESFDEELKIITAKKRELWVRAIGMPVYHENTGKIIGAKGVFQDIDERKNRELALQASINLIDDQNKRLHNFAHIVSHNLRSYSNNLALTLSLMEMGNEPTEMNQFLANLSKISESFKKTLEHLNEIMAAQAEDESVKVNLKFDTALNSAISALKTEIDLSKANIKSDFSKCEELLYIPAYLESIFLNLLSNAIKYRRMDVAPIINIYTEKIDGKPVLNISDNGLGIDLEKYGHKLFGMYKTFHHHPDAKGIGLYITKNQVESLGGKITVDSTVNEGTTFKVYF